MKRIPVTATVRRLALIVLAGLIVGGCTPPGTHRKVRGMIRGMVEKELGPADRYEIDTSRDSLQRLMDGRMSDLRIRGYNVRPAPGYVLDELDVKAKNVRFNRSAKTVEGAEEANITAWISEKSLAEMIAQEGSLAEPSARITRNGVEISGRYQVAGALPLNITATGRLRVAGTSAVEFVSDRVTAAGVPMPFPVNRTIDFATLYEPLIVHGVATEPGNVVLTGTVDWTKFGKNGDPR